MKNIVLALMMLSVLPASACAGAQAKSRPAKFKSYVMDKNYFSCIVPVDWDLEREKERDEEYRIYEIQLIGPDVGRETMSIFVSFYAKDNEDFNGYRDFVKSNSSNVAGETKTSRENYQPVKNVKVAGRKAKLLVRERQVFLFPNSKSDDSVKIKEKLYVLPAKAGFYVLHFKAPSEAYPAYLPVFERVAESFKGLR